MNTKSVQVVMSTYNGEKYLKEQIDSILSQEGVDVRLYIRDDGSSDRTTDILASYQEHKNVKIEKGNNLGFAKSFLTALDECDEADYYAFSDQDDVWEKISFQPQSRYSKKKVSQHRCCIVRHFKEWMKT